MMKLAILKAQGFDKSHHVPFTSFFHLGCSQCESLVINGFPTHEHGCPNQRFECKGCDALIDHPGYCQDCFI